MIVLVERPRRHANANIDTNSRLCMASSVAGHIRGFADLHLAIRPGADVAVFAGLLVYLVERGVCDDSWTREFATGFADATVAARGSAPSLAGATERTVPPPGEARPDWWMLGGGNPLLPMNPFISLLAT
jgi:anaerobic selenocysteine-containing dehydrogenase